MKTKIIVSVLTIIISLATSYCAYAWVEPTTIPPGDNIFAPLNSSSFGQSKLGGLILNLGQAAHGLIVRYGLVGIGTDSPESRLDVRGETRTDSLAVRGNAGVNANLTVVGTTTSQTSVSTPQLCLNGTCRNSWANQELRVNANEIAFRNTDWGDDSDPYRMKKTRDSGNNNHLDIQLNDDWNEELRIYGNSCSGYSCGEYSGNLYHYFRADGTAYHTGSSVAPIFYDQNNAGYYVNPDGWSNVNYMMTNYLIANPQNNDVEGGEIRLRGATDVNRNLQYGDLHIDNIAGYARIHSFANGKFFQLVNGAIQATSTTAFNYFANSVGIGTDNPRNDIGWTAALDVNGQVKAARYFDDNVNYYADLNSGGKLGGDWTFDGNVCLGGVCKNVWPSFSSTDTLQTVTNRGNTTTQTIVAPIMYDQNNAGYYVNPDGWTRLQSAFVDLGMDHSIKTAGDLQNNTTLAGGIFQNNGDGLKNASGSNTALGGWWHVINMHHQHNNGYNAQIAVPLSASPNDIFFRTSSNQNWSDWRKVISEDSPGVVNTLSVDYLKIGSLVDRNDSNYCIDPNSWSKLVDLDITGNLCIDGGCLTKLPYWEWNCTSAGTYLPTFCSYDFVLEDPYFGRKNYLNTSCQCYRDGVFKGEFERRFTKSSASYDVYTTCSTCTIEKTISNCSRTCVENIMPACTTPGTFCFNVGF